MNDAVDRLLVEREAMDRGFPAGVILSVGAHLVLVGGSLLAAVLGPKQPLIQVADGFSVALPPGGGGSPNLEPPAPATPEAPPVTAPAAPKPEAAKILKPPKDEKRKGLPAPDAKKSKQPEKPPPSRAGLPGGTGTATQTPGIEFGAPGPGAPGGTDMLGDWYLAGVQRKVWMLWTQQIRPVTTQSVVVSLTILADGNVTDVNVVQSSGISLVDRAAQRAIQSAAPFGPLPKAYATDRYSLTATFRPTS